MTTCCRLTQPPVCCSGGCQANGFKGSMELFLGLASIDILGILTLGFCVLFFPRFGLIGLGVALLVLGLLGNVIWQGRERARREMLVFTSLTAQAMKDEQFDRAMRFVLQAYPARGAMQ
jgi:hypothetical protein